MASRSVDAPKMKGSGIVADQTPESTPASHEDESVNESNDTPRRRRRSRRTYSGRRPTPTPSLIIGESKPEPQPAVAEMGIEPSHAKERAVYEPTDEDNAALIDATCAVLDAVGLPYEVEFEHGDYQRVWIDVDRGKAGSLIGKRGAAIDALEHLLARMCSHKVGHLIPVQVDVNNYRKRAEDEIREDALARAQRVLETGKDDHLPPMRPRDRRVVHIAVKAIDGLETYTIGEGQARHVVIVRQS